MDVRRLRDDLPTIDVGLVRRRGPALEPAVAEFIEVARESPRSRRSRRS